MEAKEILMTVEITLCDQAKVLYAGELEYEQGVGVTMWNNHSGHYTPSAKDHVRVHLDPSTFVPYDEEE